MARTSTRRRTARTSSSARAATADANPPAIGAIEFSRRRANLLKVLDGSVGLVFAGEADPSLHTPFHASAHFEYLTGITDESGASLLLDPRNPNPARRVQLFLRPLNPEREKWDGFRPEIGSELRARTGIETIFRSNLLPMQLLDAARRARQMSLLMPLATHTAPLQDPML
jgi:intermediate cleaving peptidase 55